MTRMLLGTIIKYIREYDLQGRPLSDYFFPYMLLCNTIGVGKIRLAMSLGSHAVTILACLRPSKMFPTHREIAKPTQSAIADYILGLSMKISVNHYALFFDAILQVWINLFQKWYASRYQITLEYNSFYGVEEKNFLKIMSDLIAINEPALIFLDSQVHIPTSYHEYFWKSVISKYESLSSGVEPCEYYPHLAGDNIRNRFELLFKLVDRILVQTGLKSEGDFVPIVFIFDSAELVFATEKDHMKDRFRMMRSVCREMFGNGFFLFTDTDIRISILPLF